MSDPIHHFEFILKKNSTKYPLGLYSDNKQQNKLTLKPQDVISSVSKQLKAIQVADTLKSEIGVCKDLQKYKISNFLSVNNLPVYEEAPKTTTKFDTQCVSDTQLINIIEDAEIIDVHRGMTQEFETTFIHHTEKHSLEGDDDDEQIDKNECIEEDNEKVDDLIQTVDSDKVGKNIEDISRNENMDKIHVNIINTTRLNKLETNLDADNSISLISPIMCSNNIIETDIGINSQPSESDENTQTDENSQMYHDCIEIEDNAEIDKSIERPVSPIFMHKNMKNKSKTPSPLIFNLERFEQFEKIAIPILEASDTKTAKQVINSQILDKELCFKIDEDIQLNEREILSPLLQNNKETKECKPHIVKDPNLDTDIELFEMDKATSEDLISKIMNENSKTNLIVKVESEILKDDILFSSDEEDNYIVKTSYQDLPFTCALETSFYNQSGVLDKTMYVGFQTASNKSIQIFTNSFAQAKSILSDEISVTDLVNNCDSTVKNIINYETQPKMDKETEFNLAQKNEEETAVQLEPNAANLPDNIQAMTIHLEGFMTASKKNISLSQKSLARCKKVFQDIDLSDNFDKQIGEDKLEEIELDRKEITVVVDIPNREVNENLVYEEMQNIDDEIIQEFENIEMSLKEDKEPDKLTPSYKDTQISETANIKNVMKDIDFDEDLTEVENKIEENILPIIMEGPKSNDINVGGFKTASNRNINISKEALYKTKNIFQDLGSTKFPNKSSKRDKEYPNLIEIEQPFTSKASFVGFKTANNKNIKISQQALAKVDNFFNDSGEIELPKKNNKDLQQNTTEENIFDRPSTSKINFVGFKTANNKDINISKEALAKTKNIFEVIDSSDFKLPLKKNTDSTKIYPDISEGFKKYDLPSLSKATFLGFKTASNKNVKISQTALAKTKNIFKDIESTDFKVTDKEIKIGDRNVIGEADAIETAALAKSSFKGFKTGTHKEIKISDTALAKTKDIFKDLDSDDLNFPSKLKNNERKADDDISTHEVEIIDLNMPSTSKESFVGFKTANNHKINISKEALDKTKNIFQSIDATDYKYPEKSDQSKKPGEETTKTHIQKNNYELEDFNQPSTSKASFIAFKTANNRNITISKEYLAKTRNIFKDIDETDFMFPENVTNDLNREDFLQNINDNKEVRSTYYPEMADVILPSTSTGFTGFKTANKKKIAISDESLANTENILKHKDKMDKEIVTKDFNREKIKVTEDVNIEVVLRNKNNYREERSTYKPEMTDFNQASTSSDFMGFKTANYKKKFISEESLAQTKNIFKEIDETDFKFPDFFCEKLENVDFIRKGICRSEMIDLNPSTSKANNKKINISEESLAKTKNIFKDFKFSEKAHKNLRVDLEENMDNRSVDKSYFESEMIDFNQTSTNKASFSGFITANNKNIAISEESLTKTKNIFKDIVANDFTYTKKPEKKFLEAAKEGKSPNPSLKQAIQTGKAKTGFKTGSNKAINVSETALAKSKTLFEDIEDYPNIDKGDIDSDIGPKNNAFRIPETTVPKFQGFQTASNHIVKVSAEALVKSRKLFQGIGVNEDLKETGENDVLDAINDPLYSPFYIGVNNDNKDKTKDDLCQNGRSSPVFRGFQTANKKPVKISEEALAKSRKLFDDIETIKDDPEPEFRGFRTGYDGEVEISQKTLIETKKLFDEVIKRSSFEGCQTTNEKKVAISDEALAKSRKLFQNLEKKEDFILTKEQKASDIKFGFLTGTNRDVLVSDEAVARSKRRFSELDDSLPNMINNKKDKLTEHNIANLIDTQVLNNFEESLHTEDFHETPVKSKRSGSPILSCPRAKQRKKFETPYSQKLPKTVKKKEINKTMKDTNKLLFTENYKKSKKYTLKDLAELTKNNYPKKDPYLQSFTFNSLLKFEFHEYRNDLSSGNLTIQSIKDLFLNSVNSKLIPTGWIDNHLQLILWKLISYEIKFNFLTVSARNVIDQLKYRYDKELYNAERPALRKILEKDDVASKTLILCIAGVFVEGVSVASATTTNNLELLVTDGWYCLKATIDKMLAQLVCQGKLVVGSKIVTNGAELVNCEQGVSPWEDTSAVRLKLFGNSTRRARWDARLGYHGNGAILSQLSSVKLEGGKVSKLRVFVTRVYPALYVEKFEDGSTVTRSERLEHLHQMQSEVERQTIIEKIYEEVEKEFSDEESQDSECLTDPTNKRTCLDSGSQIAKVMKRSKDPADFRAGLTSSQKRLLDTHTTKHREHLLQNIQQKIRQKIEKAGVCVNRSVVTLLKIRVAGVRRSGGEVAKGMMSIWKPPEAVLEIIKEGTWIDVMNVVPTGVRFSEIQISAGRQSVFSTSKYKEPENVKPYTKLLKRICYTIKDLSQNPCMATDYNEIDTVGFVFLIDPSNRDFDSTKQPFQNVFLADADKNMICVNFWGGLKKFGYQNVLDTGQIVYGANLQKRAGNTRKSIPQYRVTEFSYFTKTPKNENARGLVDDLSKKFLSLDRRKFCEDCVVFKNNYAVVKLNNENVSPYRFNTSDFNMSKNKMFIDSPLARQNKDDSFNLTGLDFESTFKQADTQNLSEEVLQRKKKVNEKIARLKMYGEPPPLSTIHIINRSKNASSSYKSPLNSNTNNSKMSSENSKSASIMSKSDRSINIASVEETSEKCGDSDFICSPVLINRTFVKNVNPIKINFDMKDNNDSCVDHFAEEFDGSPPLSLD